MLTTAEAFALKADANGALRQRWMRGSAAQRQALLAEAQGQLTLAMAMSDTPDGRPRHIDTAEWFASPRDVARVLARFARADRAEARAILAVNPGLAVASQGQWPWVGYKGGSETGVIAMSYLVRLPDGGWRIVTGSWNNPVAAVDDKAFAALMERALTLVSSPARP